MFTLTTSVQDVTRHSHQKRKSIHKNQLHASIKAINNPTKIILFTVSAKVLKQLGTTLKREMQDIHTKL